MATPVRSGYSAAQVALHWVIAILIVLQIVFHEGMVDAWRAYSRNGDTAAAASLSAQAHVWGGITVLAFAVWRLWLRQTRGVPAPPAEEAAPLRVAAHVTHVTLYALMILVPITGAAAWFGGVEAAGEIHELLRIPLIALILLHVAGALYQRFILKSNVLTRMFKPEV
jgi:cytochrome b561